jgi:hypothetical protein
VTPTSAAAALTVFPATIDAISFQAISSQNFEGRPGFFRTCHDPDFATFLRGMVRYSAVTLSNPRLAHPLDALAA